MSKFRAGYVITLWVEKELPEGPPDFASAEMFAKRIKGKQLVELKKGVICVDETVQLYNLSDMDVKTSP